MKLQLRFLCLALGLSFLQPSELLSATLGKSLGVGIAVAITTSVGSIAWNKYNPAIATAEQKELKALFDLNSRWLREGVLEKLSVARCPIRVKDAYEGLKSLAEVSKERDKLSPEKAKNLDQAVQSSNLILNREVYLALSERPHFRGACTVGTIAALSSAAFWTTFFWK